MITRKLGKIAKKLFKEYPILTILGPRQSGKSTLVKALFPDARYINLERPDEREIITNDPQALLSSIQNETVIIDEVQRAPSLLSYLQVHCDEKGTNGQFILTGSHQLLLHEAITQSLAGRTAILKLYPLSLSELQDEGVNLEIDDWLLQGFYPKLYQQPMDTHQYYQNYISTYVERDVRQMINVKDLSQFQSFLELTAGRIGQLVNYSSLGNELGLSNHTIKQWFSILEASHIIFKLRPYFENIGKRIVKSPKIYFTDPGLVCYLLGIENKKQLARDPIRGHLFENMVVMELVKSRYNLGKTPHIYFYRDNHGNEVDLICKMGVQLIPTEIKSAHTFHSEFLKGLKYFQKLVPGRIEKSYLVYAGDQKYKLEGNIQLAHFSDFTSLIQADLEA